ncbi:MAG: hypothetical protein EBZ48_06800, partial [Proteobacteria bacterium]|nr:hypothetical protein [Pseudomonadota bacterium]
KGCQEDYSVAGQLKGTPQADATETPTASPTTTGTPATPTSTATSTVSASPTVTRTPSLTHTPTPTGSPTVGTLSAANPMVISLAALATRTAQEIPKPGAVAGGAALGAAATDATWLGSAFADDAASEEDHNPLDSDNDGYSDACEKRYGGNPLDARSAPQIKTHSSLSARLTARGTSVDATRTRIENERTRGAKDSDGDGISDDVELLIGSSTTHSDTDGDGILDGREVQIGSDPVAAE